MDNIFTSNYSTSNPFSMSSANKTPSLDDSLMESYARLEALKAKQAQINALTQQSANSGIQGKETVFSDIANEYKGLSEDEIAFINNSPEYQAINTKYQNEFSQFLISKFAGEYLQQGNGKTLEEMLHVIRSQKEKYKEKFAADINEIRDQNKELLTKNNELAKSNQALQDELKKIQMRLADD